ncbi:unnamed protein product [Camellia sinensis]
MGGGGILIISGKVSEDPVVSNKSGLLFEKRLIERHISEYGKCLITGEALSMDDIVPIKTDKVYSEAMTSTSRKHSRDAWDVPNRMG